MMYILKDKKVVQVKSLCSYDYAAHLEWVQWLKTHDMVVAKTIISREIEISTVFLGISLSFGKTDVFQTLVFGGRFDRYQQQYSSWEEAEQGHDAIVSLVETGLNNKVEIKEI